MRVAKRRQGLQQTWETTCEVRRIGAKSREKRAVPFDRRAEMKAGESDISNVSRMVAVRKIILVQEKLNKTKKDHLQIGSKLAADAKENGAEQSRVDRKGFFG